MVTSKRLLNHQRWPENLNLNRQIAWEREEEKGGVDLLCEEMNKKESIVFASLISWGDQNQEWDFHPF